MSYDLNFWKQKPGITKEPQEIYEALCDDRTVDGLENLPIDEFLDRIRQTFPNTTEAGAELHGDTGDGAFTVSYSRQHVRVDCYGMSGEEMNKFIDIALEFDCRLFDPQTGQRYDTV